MQRIITGVVSALLLLVVMYLRGWVFDIGMTVLSLFGCYEMIKAFRKAGLQPAIWPIYGMGAVMLPVYLLLGSVGVYMLAGATTMFIMLQITLRKHPQWLDTAASLNVLVNVLIPLTLFYPIIRIQPPELGALLVFLVFVIALIGDTFAYFVGISLGSHRMAPEVSPKKTWEGSVGGLLGSIGGAMLLGWLGNSLTPMPPVWHFAILGFIGGIAGQLGDLSASIIKRHCGIKDFGTMFPGHGGMLDRFDSIFFVIYVIFGYCMVTGLFV